MEPEGSITAAEGDDPTSKPHFFPLPPFQAVRNNLKYQDRMLIFI